MSGVFDQTSSAVCSESEDNCYIDSLPAETLTQLFLYLDACDIVACSRTCRYWRNIIKHSEEIWRSLCRTLTNSYHNIEADRITGYTWQAIYQRHYGANGLKRLWRQGMFSNPHSYTDLLDKPFCYLDTQSWGQILEWELDRP